MMNKREYDTMHFYNFAAENAEMSTPPTTEERRRLGIKDGETAVAFSHPADTKAHYVFVGDVYQGFVMR